MKNNCILLYCIDKEIDKKRFLQDSTRNRSRLAKQQKGEKSRKIAGLVETAGSMYIPGSG